MQLVYKAFLNTALLFLVMLATQLSHASFRVSAHTKDKLQKEFDYLNLTLGAPLYIRIFKQESQLELWTKTKKGTFLRFRTYPICKYSGKLGPKIRQGDKQAPEGFYTLTEGSLNPNSRYHLSLNLGYPNAYDSHHNRTGDYLMIHGECVSIGCYAMGNAQIEEIYYLLEQFFINQPDANVNVYAFPFKLNDNNLKQHQNSPWHAFWKELQPIYLATEEKQQPISVIVDSGHYRVAR